MKIIIIGCGKVGLTLAELLSAEKHDVVLVDESSQKLSSIPEELDALRILGNGASVNIQQEAGVEEADLLIAVTGSDELNLLCCLIAKKAGNCHTIARVRNPIYNKEIGFIKEKLGISMIINPELTAATEISRLLRFPSAIKIDTFAKGRVELLKFRIKPEFHLNNMPVSQIGSHTNSDILICAVERGDLIAIPDGNFILRDNDLLSIIASPQNASTFFKHIGFKTGQVKNAMIVGGGKLGYYTANLLQAMNINVRIVENNRDRCEQLSVLLPDSTIIYGDGTDKQLLLEEGLSEAESFLTLTGLDEENILLSLFAKANSNAKLITKVTKIAFTEIINNLDIGSVIYPKHLTADYILQYVRAMSNSIGSNVETLYQILDGRAEALEFAIHDTSAVTDIPLAELKLKSNLLIGSIPVKGEEKEAVKKNILAILKEKYDITLERVPMDIDAILSQLSGEISTDKKDGDIDMIWINGENFKTCKENNMLYGPFAEELPNFQSYIDTDDEETNADFCFPIEGYEAPYGKAQLVMIADTAVTPDLPTNTDEFMEFCKANKGKVTYPALPDFTGSAFVRNVIYDICGYEQFMDMEADKETVKAAIEPALEYLRELNPYLWNEGKTFPKDSTALTNMYSDGEVVMDISYSAYSTATNIENGTYTETSQSFQFEIQITLQLQQIQET